MKYLPTIAGALLGLAFLFFGTAFFIPPLMAALSGNHAPPPEGSPVAAFGIAFFSTGYMAFVKVFEILGGLLTAIPKTRNWGLLILGPILVNIIAFTIFIAKENPANPMLIGLSLLALYLLWADRARWLGLLHHGNRSNHE